MPAMSEKDTGQLLLVSDMGSGSQLLVKSLFCTISLHLN